MMRIANYFRAWWQGRQGRERIPDLSRAEYLSLDNAKRAELHQQRSSTRLQLLTVLGVLGGVIFTAGGLVYTARTLRVSQDSLNATRETQITDRYTKAVEQLGSSKMDVRMGGLYALERLAADSTRDRLTIINVVDAFIRSHFREGAKSRMLGGKPRPSEDILAGLRVQAQVSGYLDKQFGPEPQWRKQSDGMHSLDATGMDLRAISADDTYLVHARFRNADLTYTSLRFADLSSANLSGVSLVGANLFEADLSGADLRQANLSGARIDEANLTGADLRGVTGTSVIEIKQSAQVDEQTKF